LVLFVKRQELAILQVVIVYLFMVTDFLQITVRNYISTNQLMTSTARVLSYTETPSEAALELPGDENVIQSGWPQNGEIEFNKVYMRYRENAPHVLKGLTLNVKSGEKIGCVGRTGAGKSSILQLLFRMVEVDRKFSSESFVKIDEVDTSNLGLHTLRKKISIIPQTPFIFSGTIRRNLDPYGKLSDQEMWNALEEVNLRGYVEGLSNGLDTDMTHASSIFSVGQKQLVCLARAILRKNKILVLDEATANIDTETDNFIQEKISKNFADCTILTIAHRLSTIAGYDKVLVMDKGVPVEFDLPFNLLANHEKDEGITRKSHFSSMVRNTGPRSAQEIFNICKKKYVSSQMARTENFNVIQLE